MLKNIKMLMCFCVALLMVASLAACGGGGGSPGLTTDGPTLYLTDAPPQNSYKEVWVTINAVEVNPDDTGWVTLAGLDLPQQIDLLTLQNGARVALGIIDLAPGHYNQMRLILSEAPGANWVKDSDDNIISLKVPSGGQTGVKLVNGFDIVSDFTDIILDFDVNKSVHVHPAGHTEKWVLRPTVRVVAIENSVAGTVYEEGGPELEGAGISAQDNGTEVAGATSLSDGSYFMYLPVNTTDSPYNLVATKENFVPACQSLDSTASAVRTGVDFTLTPFSAVPNGTLTGSIINLPVPGLDDTFVVSFSIWQEIDCSGDDVPDTMVEIKSFNFVNADGADIVYADTTTPIALPVGEYEIVAWADGPEGTIELDSIPIAIVDSVETPQNIDFTVTTP